MGKNEGSIISVIDRVVKRFVFIRIDLIILHRPFQRFSFFGRTDHLAEVLLHVIYRQQRLLASEILDVLIKDGNIVTAPCQQNTVFPAPVAESLIRFSK